MSIPTPVEFWTLNNTLVGVNGTPLVSGDGNEYFVALGKIGQCWDCGNLVERRLIANVVPTPATSWTVTCWVRASSLANGLGRPIFQLRNGATVLAAAEYSKTFSGAQTLRGFAATASSSAVAYGSNDQSWKMVALRYDAAMSEVAVILNGSKTTFTFESISPAGACSFELASRGGTASTLPCEIDAVGYWDAAISDEVLAEIYNSGNGWEPSAAPVTGEYVTIRWTASGEVTVLRKR
jgi:hypothetical protein